MKKTGIIAVFTAFCLGGFASAAILAVDFHQFESNVAQDGFDVWLVGDSSQPYSTVINSYSLTMAGGPSNAVLEGVDNVATNSRGRPGFVNSDDFTYGELLKRRVVASGTPTDPSTGLGVGNGLYVQISGLEPNANYIIQAWGIDFNNDDPGIAKEGYNYLFDATREEEDYESLPELGNYRIAPGTTTATSNDDFSITGSIQADENGTIILKSISNMDGSGIMNGFVLSIPEPSSSLLGVFGAVALLVRRRRG